MRETYKYFYLYISVFILTVISFFTLPFHIDEMFYQLILSNYERIGEFKSGFRDDLYFTFARPYLFILSTIDISYFEPYSYFYLRLPNLIISLIILFIFTRHLQLTVPESFWLQIYGILLLTYFIGTNAAGISSRPDLITTLISLITIINIKNYLEKQINRYSFLILFLSSILVSFHHLNVFYFLVNFLLFALFFFNQSNNIDKFKLFLATVFIGLISIKLLLWNDGPFEFFTKLSHHNNEVLDGSFLNNIIGEFWEFSRLKDFIHHNFKFFILACLNLFIAIPLLIISREKNSNYLNSLIVLFFSGILFLSILPDKFSHHYSLIIVPFILILISSIDKLKLNKHKLYFIQAAYTSIIIVLIIISSLFFFRQLYTNYYYNNYLQLYLSNLTQNKFIINQNVVESNMVFSKINKMYNNKTFLIDLPMYPLINKTKFMKKNNYDNLNADYMFLNLFSKKMCKDIFKNKDNKVNNDSKKLNTLKDTNLVFSRNPYTICEIK